MPKVGLHTNRQGSTISVSDASATKIEGPYTYDAYGQGAPTTGFAFKYTGRKLDAETALYFYRARYYSPALGRFLQTDPVWYGPDLNWYAYVGNDPVDKSDPTGNAACDEDPHFLSKMVATGDMTQEEADQFGEQQTAGSGAAALTLAGEAGGFAAGRGLIALSRTGAFANMSRSLGRPLKLAFDDAQWGEKAGKHMEEFGLSARSGVDRAAFRKTVTAIGEHPDRVANGTWAGQGVGKSRGPVQFRVKGNDVVVTTRDGRFVTVLKDGVNNEAVKRAFQGVCTGSRIVKSSCP